MYDLGIIGGGASGLIAAVHAAEYACAQGNGDISSPLRIVVFEATDKIGRPILRSGNGRCNFSNAKLDPDLYHNASFVRSAFDALAVCSGAVDAVDATLRFFSDHGLVWREEDDGRLYPLANKASVVLDILRDALERFGVEIRLESSVVAIEPNDDPAKFHMLKLVDGVLERVRSVLICAGGTQMQGRVSESFELAATTPVLGPIATRERLSKELDNIRVRASISLLRDGDIIAVERGELMFRKYGVSGIAVFNLSRHMRKGDALEIDFLPDIPKAEIRSYLIDRAESLAAVSGSVPTAGRMLCGMLLEPVAEAVLRQAHLSAEDLFPDCDPSKVQALARALKAFHLECAGIGDESLCQVMRGGIAVDAIDPQTMVVKGKHGIYAAGEVIDVDGPCGGYNLEWAFASGMLAARSAIDFLGMQGRGSAHSEQGISLC